MANVFISYRREDSAGYAGRLHEELAGRLGDGQVFRDVDTLQPGQDFHDAIRQRLEGCRACVVMIGRGWLHARTATGARRLDQPDDYVCMEVAAALARADVPVVPVLVGGATMPGPEELPEAIRPLARRHAISVRDETWEADMDRIAAALRPVLPTSSSRSPLATPASAARRTSLVVGALLLIAAAALTWWAAGGGGALPGVTGARDVKAEDAAARPAEAIDVPTAGAEVAHGELVFAILSGSVQPRGDRMRVWLRVRASNEGFDHANVGDETFALVAGGTAVPSTAGLNEVLERRSLRQYVIQFDAPRASTASLRITHGGEVAELPLDLTSTGAPPRHEEEDPRDALSHAAYSSVLRTEAPLVAAGSREARAMRITLRRFVNKGRLAVVVLWRNDGRTPMATGDLVLRLGFGGQTLAPVRAPNEVVEANATFIGDVVFEVPPGTTSGTLRATLDGVTSEMPLQF